MHKLLIIGAGGNLGQDIKKEFEKGDYDITAWDKSEIDITDKELVAKKVSDIKPDIIINCAAYNAVDKIEESEDDYETAKKVNIDGPRNLAEAALANNAIIVQYSSDYVFDGSKEEGYEEDDETGPINRYGKSKNLGERAVIELSGKGLKWFLVRTSKLFGPKGSSEAAKPSFFDLILKLSKVRKEFNMVDKEEMSCFTYTVDLAKATRQLIEQDYGYGKYHIVNEGAASWYDGAAYMFKQKGVTDVKLNKIKSADYERSAKRPKYSVLVNTKFPKLRTWNEALKEYFNNQ